MPDKRWTKERKKKQIGHRKMKKRRRWRQTSEWRATDTQIDSQIDIPTDKKRMSDVRKSISSLNFTQFQLAP